MITVTRTHIDASATSPPAMIADQHLNAMMSLVIGGLSPTAVQQAWWDWAQHLLLSPDKQAELVSKAVRKWQRFGRYGERSGRSPCEPCIEPLPRASGFSTRLGSIGPSMCSIRASCCNSSGGMRPPPAYRASRATMRRW